MKSGTGILPVCTSENDGLEARPTKKLSQNRWHGRLARADLSQCERSAMMKRTGETPVPPEVGF